MGLVHIKQRLVVTISKVVAQSKSVSHMGKKMDQKLKSVNHMGKKMDNKLASVLVLQQMRWASAMRSIWKCTARIEKIGGSRVDTEPTAWGLHVQV